jgi:putative holliday junction resolvase
MSLLGIDLGSKRIGIAKTDELGWAAHPLCVIQRRGGERDLEAISSLVEEHATTAVVVGLPLNMDDSEGRAAVAARRFAKKLADHLGIAVHLWDERLTTWEAQEILKRTGVKTGKRRKLIDQLAAALILESYLQAHRQEDE